MFKKVILIVLVLVFALGILLVSIESTVNPTKAASTLTFTVEPEEKDASPAAQEKITRIDYFLPYPGILPDHPFYKLKMVRDRIWLFLTRNPLKREELLLLFANKRVGAGEILIRGNKFELGVSTMTKGVKYLERAINGLSNLEGEERRMMKEELQKALLKYDEIVNQLLEKGSGEKKFALEEIRKFIENLHDLLGSLE